jgi:hypothetical protein
MIDHIPTQRLSETITAALADGTRVIDACGSTRVVLPVPDAFGDHITLSVMQRRDEPDRVIVTDLGHTCSDVVAVTGKLRPATERYSLFFMAARNHGVQVREGCLEVECDRAAIGDAALAVMGAVKEAHQLVHFGKAAIGRMFREEVGIWLRSHDVVAEADFEVVGRSPAAHTIDFVVAGAVPTYLETISNENKMRGALLTFYDLAGTHDFRAVAIIDDEDAYTNRTFQQLAFLVPHVYRWTQRERLLELLVA